MASNRKIKPSYKLFAGAVGVFVTGYLAWNGYAAFQLNGVVLDPMTPTRVSLIAIRPDAGYKIIVANQMAQLIETSSIGSQASDTDINTDVSGDTSSRKRLPVKELLGSLQGDQKALGDFIMRINDIDRNDFGPEAPVWTSENIQKAIDSPGPLRTKLEDDLNVRLDGTPLDHVSMKSVTNGITIDIPVKIAVNGSEPNKVVTARVQSSYKPQLSLDIEDRLQSRSTITDAIIQGEYQAIGREILSGKRPQEQVKSILLQRISAERSSELAKAPARILAATFVLLTTDQMQGSQLSVYTTSNGATLVDLTIRVNDLGKKRLWKYSRTEPGFQLLLTVDGIPVGAPRIRGEIISNDVKISQLPDAGLAKDTQNAIQECLKEKGNS
ncbi:MAG: hypothetical protein J0L72_07715 [Armatimonadetes bacterium]|nr:hypothetical protein [Armatimonadota bacterium]